MKHETSMALYAYWRSCSGQKGVPARDIRPAELAPLLPSLFLIDMDLAAGARFRFCGAALAMRYGRDLTDESFLDLWSGEDRATLERGLKAFSPGRAGFVAGVMAETMGAGFTAFEMLVLPLAGASAMAGAIGSMVRIGGHEEMNRIRARLVSQSLRSVRYLEPATSPAAPAARQPDLVARGSSPSDRRYRHLTLVPGGKRIESRF